MIHDPPLLDYGAHKNPLGLREGLELKFAPTKMFSMKSGQSRSGRAPCCYLLQSSRRFENASFFVLFLLARKIINNDSPGCPARAENRKLNVEHR